MNRTIENPIIGDKVTFLRTARETGGAQTIVEVELAPKGGNSLHFHQNFEEVFTCKRGQLSLEVNGATLHLLPGESATAPAGSLHRFFNETHRPVLFEVELNPGSEGFEQSLHIAYGLAKDGACFANGVPKNIYHLALVLVMSETRLPGAFRLIEPILQKLYRRAIHRGVKQALIERYCASQAADPSSMPAVATS